MISKPFVVQALLTASALSTEAPVFQELRRMTPLGVFRKFGMKGLKPLDGVELRLDDPEADTISLCARSMGCEQSFTLPLAVFAEQARWLEANSVAKHVLESR